MPLRFALSPLAILAFAAPAFADDCAAPLAAQALAARTPHKLTTTQSGGGATHTNKLIQTADKIYVQIDGKWRLSPRTPAQSAADAAEITKTAKYTCKGLGSDTVNGEAADVFQIHSVNNDLVSDNKVWVSKSKKITIKVESTADQVVFSNVYDYANVQPPTGVN